MHLLLNWWPWSLVYVLLQILQRTMYFLGGIFKIVHQMTNIISKLEWQLLAIFGLFDRHVVIHGIRRQIVKPRKWIFTWDHPSDSEVISELYLRVVVRHENIRFDLRIRFAVHQSEPLKAPRLIDGKNQNDIIRAFESIRELLGRTRRCRPDWVLNREFDAIEAKALYYKEPGSTPKNSSRTFNGWLNVMASVEGITS